MKRIPAIIAAVFIATVSFAQTSFQGTVSFDRTVHDFGDVLASDGPLSCSFKVSNISDRSVSISSVISSCGCTDVKWTTKSLKPGESGVISAVYSNDEGPYPFDKTLTAYIEGVSRPIVLHIRGSVHDKALPLGEAYPVHFGDIALRSAEIKAGNMSQGECLSGEFIAANIGKAAATLSFADIDPDLSFSPSMISIAAGSTATISFTVRSDRGRWGKNWYYATPLVGGKSVRSKGKPAEETAAGAESLQTDPNPLLAEGGTRIGLWAITKEDFSALDKRERREGSNFLCPQSTFQLGQIKSSRAKGGSRTLTATFEFSNSGRKPLVIHKADCESARVGMPQMPGETAPGGTGTLEFTVDTAGLPKGEVLFLITLYTNSPQRPMANLFISGFVR